MGYRPVRALTRAAAVLLMVIAALPAVAGDNRETWLMQTLRDDNPVREQLAMLGQPGRPVTLRIYRGRQLPCGRRARVQDGELALSEGLLDEMLALEQTAVPAEHPGRWSLLYVLAYLGERATQPAGPADAQRRARAMLGAANQVMAGVWEQAGRPHRAGQRAGLYDSVLLRIPYAGVLARPGAGLRRDADGFVLDSGNVQRLTQLLASAGIGDAGLD